MTRSRLALLFTALIWAFLTLSVGAQVPQPVAVPYDLADPPRSQLSQRRAGLLSQRDALRIKVDAHNQKCRSVVADTPLADECRQKMAALQADIAAYVAAVNSFNEMIAQLPASTPQGQPSALLSERGETDLGRAIAGELDSQMRFVTDTQVMTYVQNLAERLTRHSTRPGLAYRVRVFSNQVKDCEFACSVMGGHIYLHSGLIQLLRNESELAGVVAHEIAHIAARHQPQNVDNYLRALGISVIAAGPLWPVAQRAMFMSFKRDQEREADRVAVEILYQAGIKPTGLNGALERIRRGRKEPSVTQVMHETYFGTHPFDQERIQNLEPLLADPRFNQIRDIDSAEFHTVRRRLVSP